MAEKDFAKRLLNSFLYSFNVEDVKKTDDKKLVLS